MNDFEHVVARRHPIIDGLVGRLEDMGAVVAMMSGSGSTVLGIFTKLANAALVGVSGVNTAETRTSERVFRVGFSFRPPEMREHHDARAALGKQVECRQRSRDPQIVSDAPLLVERHVEIHADHDAFAANVAGNVAH